MNGPLNQLFTRYEFNNTIEVSMHLLYEERRKEKKTNMDWVPVSIIDYNCCGEIHLNKYF